MPGTGFFEIAQAVCKSLIEGSMTGKLMLAGLSILSPYVLGIPGVDVSLTTLGHAAALLNNLEMILHSWIWHMLED